MRAQPSKNKNEMNERKKKTIIEYRPGEEDPTHASPSEEHCLTPDATSQCAGIMAAAVLVLENGCVDVYEGNAQNCQILFF